MSITYQDLVLMDIDEVRKIAEGYKIKTAGQNRSQLLDAIQFAAIRKEEDVRQKVVEAKRSEALLKLGLQVGSKKRPSAENVAILASRKVIAEFLNREDPGGDEMGTDIVVLKGSFRFHLYDGMSHVLPECLVVDEIDQIPEVRDRVIEFFVATGMTRTKAAETTKGVLERLALPIHCQRPIYAERKLPSGETRSEIVQWVPRFKFIISSKEPSKHAEFGVIESEVLHV